MREGRYVVHDGKKTYVGVEFEDVVIFFNYDDLIKSTKSNGPAYRIRRGAKVRSVNNKHDSEPRSVAIPRQVLEQVKGDLKRPY